MYGNGIKIDALNTVSWSFVGSNIKKLSFFYESIKRTFQIPLLGKILRRLFQTRMLKQVSSEYDFIDIHYFSRNYLSFLHSCNKPFKITVWGSDFYRISKEEASLKKKIYRKAAIIQVETKKVKADLVDYDRTLENKIRVCNFGIDLIDEMSKFKGTISKKEGDKIVITCGYNGDIGQQHIKMIDSIKALPKEIRTKLLVYLPVTYGLSQVHKNEIEGALKDVDFEYRLFVKRLTNEELAILRIETDIAINIQLSDSLSSSLLQHLYAGSILLLGDWLPHTTYDDNDLFYKRVSIQELTNTIIECVSNLSNYKEKATQNEQKVISFASWQSVDKKQCGIYKELVMNNIN